MFGDYTSYATVLAEIQGANAQIANSASYTGRITRLITSASRMIDRWCLVPDRFFLGQAETRFFDVPPTLDGPMRWMHDVGIGESGAFTEVGGPTLTIMGIANGEVPSIRIDPLVGIPDEVAVDQSLDGTYSGIMTYLTDFDLYPINAPLDGYPFYEIRWLPATATISFPVGQRTLRMKGLWGYQSLTQTVQTLGVSGTPTGGTFTLSYGGKTTAAIAFNAQGKDVQSALSALSSLSTLTGNYQGSSPLLVSDGQLPNDTITLLVDGLAFTGLTLGANNLTGGTTPNVTLGAIAYIGPTAHPSIEQACILQVIKWLNEPSAAPLGMAGSPELGYTKVQPSDSVLEILEDGHFVDHWLAV